jgi:hypothetical protein
MMYEFLTSCTIQAPPERVWEILTTSAGYAEWNPEIVAIDGLMALRKRIRARVKVGSGAIRTVPMRVTDFGPPVHMVWKGGLPLGLFTGRRIFDVVAREDATEFRMLVQMSGLLAGLMVRSVGNRQAEIDSFSSALKARAEKSQHS